MSGAFLLSWGQTTSGKADAVVSDVLHSMSRKTRSMSDLHRSLSRAQAWTISGALSCPGAEEHHIVTSSQPIRQHFSKSMLCRPGAPPKVRGCAVGVRSMVVENC